MLVTLFGIVMLVNPVQPLKAFQSMLVTLFGISMLVKPLQQSYLYITTSQHLTYKRVEKRSGIFDN